MAPTENCWDPSGLRVGLGPSELVNNDRGIEAPTPPDAPTNSRRVAWSAGNPKLKAAPAEPPLMENCAALKVPLEVIKPTLPVRLRKPIAPGDTVMVPPPPATKLPKLKPCVIIKV